MNVSQLKLPAAVVITGLALGLVGDLMFYGQPLGISVPILTAAALLALLVLASFEKAGVVLSNLWLIAPLLFLSAMSAVRAEPSLRFLNVAGTLALALLLANRLATRPLTALNVAGYVDALLESSLFSLVIPIPLLGRALREKPTNASQSKHVTRQVLVGLLIALPFLLLFASLFASADLIFGNMVQDILEAINLPDIVGHIFLTVFLGWLAMGGLAYGLTRTPDWKGILGAMRFQPAPAVPAQSDEALEPADPPAPTFTLRTLLGPVESSVVLFSIDALFLIFVVIQFAALFGGEAFLRSQGLTYSEYARRGFFELLTVSLITLGLILTLDYVTRRQTERHHLVFLVGSGLMIGMTIIILASAFQRLQLYEWAYGFTRLRVFPHVFMVWLAILFAAFLVILIARRIRLFATAALIAALGFVITLDILNPDAFIVRENLQRYRDGQELDVEYLGSLSEDAVPYLMPLLSDYGPEIGAQIGPWLRYHLERLDERQAKAGWPAYHWSINQAFQVLDVNRDLIEQFELPARYSYGD